MLGLFADLKGAFDAIDRKAIWKKLEEAKIDKNLVDRIKELYERTSCEIWIKGERIGGFFTNRGVRQGCPLSPLLFNIALGDLEREMRRAQEGGVFVGKRKIWTISYADDVVILANNRAGMRESMRIFGKYIRKIGLELNTEKTKMVVFKKGRTSKERDRWKWGENEIEEVKKVNYLGFVITKSNNEMENIKERVKKARMALGGVWSLGEYLCKDDWRRRARMFEAVVGGIMCYGAEIWGWEEYREIEAVHNRFMRWTLGVNRCTPGYLLREETGRKRMIVRTSKRAYMYECKLRRERSEGSLLGECSRASVEGQEEEWVRSFSECGIDKEEAEEMFEEGPGKWKDLEELLLGKQYSEDKERIKESRFMNELKEGRGAEEDNKDYLFGDGTKRRGELKIIARFKLGSESRSCEYWRKEEERRCRICGKEEETLEHIFERCENTKIVNKDGKKWWTVYKGKGSYLGALKKITWLREEFIRNQESEE